MNLADLILFILGTSGLTVIIVLSHILEPIREFIFSKSNFLEKLLSCTMCSGFWVGATLSYWYNIDVLLGATTTSLCSWMISNFVEMVNTITLYAESKIIEYGELDEKQDE